MTFCDNCLKPITGQYHYSPEKNDDKKFCSAKCMYEHYGFKCEECGKILPGVSINNKDDKRFCSTTCMNKHSNKETKEQASDFWAKYKGWIIGGGIVLVLLIILGAVLGGSEKKRRR